MFGFPARVRYHLGVDERSSAVVRRHRFAFGLVGVEQTLVRSPSHYRGEFPGKVLRVLNAAVHAKAAVRRKPVCGVTAEEGPANPPGVGDGLLVVPAEYVEDFDVEVGVAHAAAYRRDDLRLGELL